MKNRIGSKYENTGETGMRRGSEEYGAIELIWNSAESDQKKAQQFVKLFKRILWNKIRETYKETAVKSIYSGIVNLLRGDPELLEHADRLRRLGNALADGTVKDYSVEVNESFKTLCLMIRKFYGHELPEPLAAACAKIAYRDHARFEKRKTSPLAVLVEVKHIDEQGGMLTCVDVESADEKELKVRYGGENDEFSDLHTYVHPGDRLCLVTPTTEAKGILKASEIVLDPDYLLSPQRMGEAFNFAKPDVYFWLSLLDDEAQKIRKVPGNGPLTMGQYLLRGNFANACLEDYSAGDDRDARNRMCRFFTSDPIGITVGMNEAVDEWLSGCYEQDANLNRFIRETIPQEHHVLPGAWQIEAPLYSPVYGLSARADAISYGADRTSATVLELKSGKWENYKGDRPKVEHAVQPIFYGDLLYFSKGIPRNAVNTLLCYSTTIPEDRWNPRKDGKLFTRAELEHIMPGGRIGQAIRCFSRVRNGIVATGALVRSGGFRAVVDALKPEDFRPQGMRDGFWQDFKRPEIEGLLSPLQTADELAKRYFYRQLAFVAEEEYLARLGERGADIGRGGSASYWRLSVDERRRAGLRLSELTVLRDDRDELERVVRVELNTWAHPLNKGCSIRAGDSVCFYKSSKAKKGSEKGVRVPALKQELF
jgi:DNA replication ATP-dependent helicase Dna2